MRPPLEKEKAETPDANRCKSQLDVKKNVDKAIYDHFRSLSHNQIFIEIRDGFTLFERLTPDTDLADQKCLTTYYRVRREVHCGVRDLVFIVHGDKTDSKRLVLQDALIILWRRCSGLGPLTACLQRDEVASPQVSCFGLVRARET